jgi:hypothetical protein
MVLSRIADHPSQNIEILRKPVGPQLRHLDLAIEHSAEHYGQLVVYYRANNLVPPDSRR